MRRDRPPAHHGCRAQKRSTDLERRESGLSRSSERLSRIECIAHRFADEDQQRQHECNAEEPCEAKPRRLHVRLALREKFTERGRTGRQAETEEVERGQCHHGRREDKRQERHRRDHRVRQQMAEDDHHVRYAERARPVIYSKLRPRRNSARTRPTSETQENKSSIPSKTKNPGTSTEEMISNR